MQLSNIKGCDFIKVGSKELIRDINNKLVIEAIIEKAPISRAELSKDLGLTKATISSIVQELINKDLVCEVGSGDTSIGRKPTMLELNSKSGHSVCIDLNINQINLMITDLLGKKLYSISKSFETGYEKNVVNIIIDLVENAKNELPSCTYGIIGITIGIHGVVHNNKISFTPYYNLTSINIVDALHEYFNVPIFLNNEANLAVLGENAFLTKVENIATIIVHSGIGLGMILNNKLYTGCNGHAGEFGHTIIELDGRQCPCGNKGCLEQYASLRVLLNDFAVKKGKASSTFDEFFKAYKNNDAVALNIVENFINIMVAGINNILNLYNPEVILFNSYITRRIPEILDKINDKLKEKPNFTQSIRRSELNDEAILYGATYINIINFLDIQNFNSPKILF